MTDRTEARRRRWADVVVIVASVYAILAAAWAPLEFMSGGGAGEVQSQSGLWIAYTVGGVLGLIALFTARRWPLLAKVSAAAGGVAVLLGFLALSEVTLLAVASLGLTGLALLAAAPFMGPMPSPEDEGRSR